VILEQAHGTDRRTRPFVRGVVARVARRIEKLIVRLRRAVVTRISDLDVKDLASQSMSRSARGCA
jgi:hypothetical protein